MLMTTETGNMDQVRIALQGITGVEAKTPVVAAPHRYLVIVRFARERDAVDSYRRNNIPTYWPSYEELQTTGRSLNGHPVCVKRRISFLSGYVFPVAMPGALDLDSIVAAIDYIRTFDGTPLLIADADIQILKRIETSLNTPKPGGADHTFKPGEKVRFSDDLIGRWPAGKVKKLLKNGKIDVEADVMGGKRTITVFPHQIERV